MDALAFLELPPDAPVQPVYALYGDEDFLKRQVVLTLRRRIFGADGDEFGFASYPGNEATWAVVRSELETLPFLSPRRLIVIENADPFVTRHRQALEEYVSAPAASGTLVLSVKTWTSTTRLARLLKGPAALECKAQPLIKLQSWCVAWAASRYGKKLAASAARLLVDLVGAEMGQLDQELAKLSTYVEPADRIAEGDVDKLVGASREENAFKMLDALAADRSDEALAILDRLFEQGDDPLRILGALGWQLRKLAQAGRLQKQGVAVGPALNRLGIFKRQEFERQFAYIGTEKANRLYQMVLETDLGLKGNSQLPPRAVLERLLLRLRRE